MMPPFVPIFLPGIGCDIEHFPSEPRGMSTVLRLAVAVGKTGRDSIRRDARTIHKSADVEIAHSCRCPLARFDMSE
jgi:hypothetical protein